MTNDEKNYGLNVGDEIEVVVRGKVTWLSGDDSGFGIKGEQGSTLFVSRDQNPEVTVLKRKVTTFGAGDVVKAKDVNNLYILGEEGFYHVNDQQWHRYGGLWREADRWTSDIFEKVEVR